MTVASSIGGGQFHCVSIYPYVIYEYICPINSKTNNDVQV